MCKFLTIVFATLLLPSSGFGKHQNNGPTQVFTKLPTPPAIQPPSISPVNLPKAKSPPVAAAPKASPATSPLQSPPVVSPAPPSPMHSPTNPPAVSPMPSEVPSTATSPASGSLVGPGPSISSPEIADGPVGDASGSGRVYAGRVVFGGLWVSVVLATM